MICHVMTQENVGNEKETSRNITARNDQIQVTIRDTQCTKKNDHMVSVQLSRDRDKSKLIKGNLVVPSKSNVAVEEVTRINPCRNFLISGQDVRSSENTRSDNKISGLRFENREKGVQKK